MSDEAHFSSNGFLNNQNCRLWGRANPRSIDLRQWHPIRCILWCGITLQAQILKDVMENALKRAHHCEAENGGHSVTLFSILSVKNISIFYVL